MNRRQLIKASFLAALGVFVAPLTKLIPLSPFNVRGLRRVISTDLGIPERYLFGSPGPLDADGLDVTGKATPRNEVVAHQQEGNQCNT